MMYKEFHFRKIDTEKEHFPVHNMHDYDYINEDEVMVLSVLQEKDIEEIEPNEKVHKYFESKWLGYGCFDKDEKMIAYCFIKNPIKRPETMTVVLSKYRNQGIARELRNFAMADAIKNDLIKGQYIYSAVEKWNIPSLISVLKSGYEIFRFEPFCEEGGSADNQFIQLHKKIR